MKKDLSTAFQTRQYMISREFELYYYCDRHLETVELHSHDYYEFYFFLEGDVSIEIAGVCIRLQYGDLVLIPPKVPHRPIIHNSNTPYRRFVFWISEDYCNHLLDQSYEYIYLMQQVAIRKNYCFHNDAIAFRTIHAKLIRLLDEMQSNRFGRNAQIPLYVNDLVLHLNRLIYERSHPKRTERDESRLYIELMDYIEEHPEDSLSLEYLSETFCVSKYYIAHLFKDKLGISIHQYITDRRLSLCRDAIVSGMEIKDAYLQYGFHDYTVFYKAFKKQFGMSPKEYAESLTKLKESPKTDEI